MIQKEGRIEIVKFFIRLAEIVFAAMIVAPTVASFLSKDTPAVGFVLILLIGGLGCLTFFGVAVILLRRWK